MKKWFKIAFSLFVLASMMLSLVGCDLSSFVKELGEESYVAEPQIKSGEFPFVLEYEYEGETYVIEDVVVCTYTGLEITDFFPKKTYKRAYESNLKYGSDTVLLELETGAEIIGGEYREILESKIILVIGDGSYYLGDPESKGGHPHIAHMESHKTFSHGLLEGTSQIPFERAEEYYGIKITRFEFSSPIENTFE